MRRLKAIHLAFLFLLALLAAPPARAALQVSEEEKAVFSFFKLAESTPDYDGWISNSPRYRQAPESQRQAVHNEEETRLKWGFGTFKPETDFLKIETEIELRLVRQGENLFLNFSFPDRQEGEAPYFPYSYGSEWIALVVDDLEKFTRIPIAEEDRAYIKEKLGAGTVFKARLKMRVRPLSVDAKAPLSLAGKEKFWLLRGDIAYLAFENPEQQPANPGASGDERKTAIFSYTAPWYLSDTEADLLKLLGE